MNQTKYDVFISYSRKDYMDEHNNVIPNNIVTEIKTALTDAGISYWFDEDGIYSGQNFVEKIVNNIELSQIFIFLSTKNANESRWTCKEISSADEFGKYIIPVRIDNSPYNKKVLFRISDLDYIDYYSNSEKGVADLIASIKMYLNQVKEDEMQKKMEEERRESEQKKSEQLRVGNISSASELFKTYRLIPVRQVFLKRNTLSGVIMLIVSLFVWWNGVVCTIGCMLTATVNFDDIKNLGIWGRIMMFVLGAIIVVIVFFYTKYVIRLIVKWLFPDKLRKKRNELKDVDFIENYSDRKVHYVFMARGTISSQKFGLFDVKNIQIAVPPEYDDLKWEVDGKLLSGVKEGISVIIDTKGNSYGRL